MIAQHEVITSYITQEDTHFVEPVVFGTTDPHKIACLIDTFCLEELGAHVANFLFYESSVGAVCGVRLVDGRRVVVKILQSSLSPVFLQAIVNVQRYLLWKQLKLEPNGSMRLHARRKKSNCMVRDKWSSAIQIGV